MTAHYGARSSANFWFNPLSIAWDHLFWAEDPAWTPPANGVGVASWRNSGVQAVAATQGTGANQPIYRANYAALANRPAIEFDGTDDFLDCAAGTARAQPNHVVLVGYLSPTAGNTPTPIDSSVSTTRHLMRPRMTPTSFIQMYAGNDRQFGLGVSPGIPFIQLGLFAGGGSSNRLNGVPYSVLDVGTQQLQNVRLGAAVGAGGSNFWKGALAWVSARNCCHNSVLDTSLTTRLRLRR